MKLANAQAVRRQINKKQIHILLQIYEAERTEELASYQIDKTEVQPQEGWYEQDPLEIMHHIRLCAENAIDQLTELGKHYTFYTLYHQ